MPPSRMTRRWTTWFSVALRPAAVTAWQDGNNDDPATGTETLGIDSESGSRVRSLRSAAAPCLAPRHNEQSNRPRDARQYDRRWLRNRGAIQLKRRSELIRYWRSDRRIAALDAAFLANLCGAGTGRRGKCLLKSGVNSPSHWTTFPVALAGFVA